MTSDVTVALEGNPTWSRDRRIGHYGGALDKTNSLTEGRVPYAWIFYRELRAGRGSAYRTAYEGMVTGLVHAENAAIARSEAARWRAGDKLENNALPLTSDETLGSWLQILNVHTFPGDTIHEIRLRCASKYQALAGASARVIDESVEALLGPSFVRTWRITGTDLATPPTPTFWPVINPGPAAYSLGGGAWLSSRSFYTAEVVKLSTMSTQTFLELMNVHLFQLLDRSVPAWASFDWAIGLSSGGFLLDISDLDFYGMIP
jgi:hypothetical protein